MLTSNVLGQIAKVEHCANDNTHQLGRPHGESSDSLVPTPSAYSSHSLSNPTLHFKKRWNVLDMERGYQKMTKEEERSWMKMAWSGERRRAKRLR